MKRAHSGVYTQTEQIYTKLPISYGLQRQMDQTENTIAPLTIVRRIKHARHTNQVSDKEDENSRVFKVSRRRMGLETSEFVLASSLRSITEIDAGN